MIQVWTAEDRAELGIVAPDGLEWSKSATDSGSERLTSIVILRLFVGGEGALPASGRAMTGAKPPHARICLENIGVFG